MRFFHAADIHLGMEPDVDFPWSDRRKREIWESFRRLIKRTGEEKPDLLLIAGDLFHRQPLLKELKEVNEMFASVPDTQVVLIAGNHDHLKRGSYYLSFDWAENVTPLFKETCERVDFPRISTAVYGCSYFEKEVTENLYRTVKPTGPMQYHILLAHGGDAKHSPWKKEEMGAKGFDYIACGHIHMPELLLPGKMAYAGALEPTTMTQTGKHGYIDGTIQGREVSLSFVPFAVCEYEPVCLQVTPDTTQYALEKQLDEELQRRKAGNLFLVTLEGKRDRETEFDAARLLEGRQIVALTDRTRPDHQIGWLKEKYGGSLIGAYAEYFENAQSPVEKKALDYGLEALLAARRE